MTKLGIMLFCVSSFCLAENANNKLDEIVVLSKKPKSNQVILDSQLIGVIKPDSIDDITAVAPGTNYYHSGRRSETTIRGFGDIGMSNFGMSPSVATFIDGIEQPNGTAIAGDVFDIKSVQVLRGPQTTHYGTNAIAGAIVVDTLDPSFDQTESSLEYRVGKFDDSNARLTFNAPFSNSVAGRFSGYVHESDGQFDNQYTGEKINFIDRKGARAKVLYAPDDTLQAVFSVDYSTDNSDFPGANRTLDYGFTQDQINFLTSVMSVAYTNAELKGYTVDRSGSLVLPDFDKMRFSSDLADDNQGNNQLYSLNLKYTGQDVDIQSITAFSKIKFTLFTDADSSNFNLVNRGVSQQLETLTQDFRLISRSSTDVGYVGGISYTETTIDDDLVYYGGSDFMYLRALTTPNPEGAAYFLDLASADVMHGKTAPIQTANDANNTQVSVYGDITIQLTQKTELTTGMRLTHVSKEFGRYQSGFCSYDTVQLGVENCTATSAFIIEKYYADVSASREEFVWGSYLKSNTDINDRIAVYAQLASGTKPGGFTHTKSIGIGETYVESVDDLEFEEETITNIEIGFNLDVPEHQWKTSGDIYFAAIHDYQLSFYDGRTNMTINADKVQSSGVELNTEYQPVNGLSILMNTSYNDAHFEVFENGICAPEEFRSLQNCSFLTFAEADAAGQPLIQDMKGENLRGPQLTAYLAAQYVKPIDDYTSWVRLENQFIGERRTTIFAHNEFIRGGFSLLNLRAGLATRQGFEMSAWINNLNDKRAIQYEYPSQVIRQITSLPGGIGAYFYPSRQWGLSIGYTF